jgi:hypothetical protein
MSKKSGTAVDEGRHNLAETRDELSGIGEEFGHKHQVRWAGVAAALAAAVAAIGALRWRRSRQQPKNRVERAWRDVKRGAKGAGKETKRMAKSMKGRFGR